MKTIEQRFWEKVKKTEQCWVWTGCTNEKGYGTIRIGKFVKKAHRISWEINFDVIPSNVQVLHKCDNPQCVRPDHLFLGDIFTNMQDMVNKGRSGSAKIDKNIAKTIRNEYRSGVFTQKQLAIKYGINQMSISNVVNNVTWKHI